MGRVVATGCCLLRLPQLVIRSKKQLVFLQEVLALTMNSII